MKSHLKDRKPMSTRLPLHNFLNKLFDKKFGWEARNGVAATGLHDEADMYGHAHVIFPIGNFEYVWSPEVTDLWGTLMMRGIRSLNAVGKSEMTKLVNNTYRNSGLHDAISQHKEVYIKCKEYYLVDPFNTNGFGGFEIMHNLGLSV
jgi:hypothetical protein